LSSHLLRKMFGTCILNRTLQGKVTLAIYIRSKYPKCLFVSSDK